MPLGGLRVGADKVGVAATLPRRRVSRPGKSPAHCWHSGSRGTIEGDSTSIGRCVTTVLLVDDEPRIVDALTQALVGQPYAVLKASSATEALDLFEGHTIDVIVSDAHMPGMTGMDLLVLLRDRYPETARILLTGRASLDLALRAINEDVVTRLLVKPVDSATLRSAIEACLARQRRRHEVEPAATLGQVPEFLSLSPRELDVLELLLAGRRVSSVARVLGISPFTVRNHVKSILRKLEVHSQEELIERYGAHLRCGSVPA